MKTYAILRVAKLKTLGQLGAANGHNTRARAQGHADDQSPLMGGGVQRLAGKGDPVQAFKDRVSETGAKPRKGAVIALEFVASASPDWFAAATPGEREEWASNTISFLTNRVGGKENILVAHLHDDETTPHIHFLAVPLIEKERKKAGRKPKRKSAQEKPDGAISWALAAADIVGDRNKLEALQSDYAAAVAHLGIRRGRPRALTQATHKSPAQYRHELQKHTETQKKNATIAAKKMVERVATAMTTGFDAVDQGKLKYKPADAVKKERLVRGTHGPRAEGLQALGRSIRPALRAILSYAKAQAQLLDRQMQVDKHKEKVAEDATEVIQMAERITMFERFRATAMRRETKSIRAKAQKIRERAR
tara:strand:- start:1033 stop:2124 length:1092 start_codon:yes stop_codon:yes gene_type:complete